MKTKVLLTFDYEIYFGDNYYSEEIILFEPTQKILDLSKKLNIKLVFFIDIYSIIAYEKNKLEDYVDRFKSQIFEMQSLGHDIQMHFHPHWIDAVYDKEKNKWNFSYENYSYSNLIDNFGLDKANNFFLDAHNLFIEIVGLRPNVFRAGGYVIQPYEKEFISLLSKLNYKIDSSVYPYKKYVSNVQAFDFLNSEELNFWNISTDTFLKSGDLELIEFPVLSIKKNIINLSVYALLKLINKIIPNKKYKRRGRGASIELKDYKNKSLQCTFDSSSYKDIKIIKFITSLYLWKFRNNNITYLNLLSHPKSMSDCSISVMNWYINYMQKKDDCLFITFKDIINEK